MRQSAIQLSALMILHLRHHGSRYSMSPCEFSSDWQMALSYLEWISAGPGQAIDYVTESSLKKEKKRVKVLAKVWLSRVG